jgi:hypothetical protein
MQPEGYNVLETGPKSFMGKGQKEYAATKERLWKEGAAGTCPFMVR